MGKRKISILKATGSTDYSIHIKIDSNIKDIGYYEQSNGLVSDMVETLSVKISLVDFKLTITNNKTFIEKYKNTTWIIDYGDGDITTIPNTNFTTIEHFYSRQGNFTVKIEQKNKWGSNIEYSDINVGSTDIAVTSVFQPTNGTNLVIDTLSSDSFLNLLGSTVISGYTSSKITSLKSYGDTPYITNKIIYKKENNIDVAIGQIEYMNPNATGYTLFDVKYIDFSNGVTLYNVSPDMFTPELFSQSDSPYIKNNDFIGFAMPTEIQSNVFIERDNVTVFDRNMKLTELKSSGGVDKYGYGFFKQKQKIG